MTALSYRWRRFPSPHFTTLLLLFIVAIAALITLAWFGGQGTITDFFEQLARFESHPPLWLRVPMMMQHALLNWQILLLLGVLVMTHKFSRSNYTVRLLVVGILLTLAVRYWLWRSLSTLNLSTPLNGVFSLGLFFLEMLIFTSGMIQLVLMLLPTRDRSTEADRLSQAVLDRTFAPTVDILIPTLNEPAFILRRTIIGAQALDYSHKTIYLLDGSRRPEIAALAAALGCKYITRSDNRHAKAGSLNHAITRSSGELIVVLDADFVPTRNFLTRTVGFFQDPQVGLVQTPQTFYNPDPIARNLGLEDVIPAEEEVFYRQIQPIRDAVGSVICSGTSFVVRRSALIEAGCFFTESLSEDYFTGVRLSAKGYRLVYLNEKLSAGLAAESMVGYALQRTRWAQGTLQAFFVSANPLTISGLSLLQRLAHLEGLLHWFSSLARIGFLLTPLAYAFLNVIPIRATVAEVLYFFMPYFLTQIITVSWLNSRARSAVLSEVYSLVLVFPLAMTVLRVLLNPFGRGFRVTPKGTSSDRFSYRWGLAFPLLLLFAVTAFGFWLNLGKYLLMITWQPDMPLALFDQLRGIGIGWFWSLYNLLILSIALLVMGDVPHPSPYEWYDLRRTVQIQVGEQTFWGTTTSLSEIAAKIDLTQPYQREDSQLVFLTFLEDGLVVSGSLHSNSTQNGNSTVEIRFSPLNQDQLRQLIPLLYCRPGQWQRRCSPGEIRSLGIVIKALLHPRVLFDRSDRLKVIPLNQV